MSIQGKSYKKIHENHDDQHSVKCPIPGDGYRWRSGTRRPWRLCCVYCVSRGDENRRSQLMWKSVLVKVMTNRLCTDRGRERCPGMIITCAQIQVAGKVIERSSQKARMTKLITSDETLEERVVAVGMKFNLHPVYYQWRCVFTHAAVGRVEHTCAGLNADTLEMTWCKEFSGQWPRCVVVSLIERGPAARSACEMVTVRSRFRHGKHTAREEFKTARANAQKSGWKWTSLLILTTNEFSFWCTGR